MKKEKEKDGNEISLFKEKSQKRNLCVGDVGKFYFAITIHCVTIIEH